MNIVSTTMRVPALVGMMSLIGVSGEPPHVHANYFSLQTPAFRVLNFWAENLQAAKDLFLKDDGKVDIRVWSWEENDQTYHCCIIFDERIPKDWYHNKLCFTGCRRPPAEVAKEIYELLGDPGFEYELFIDPEMYYAKRNQRYHKGGGVSYSSGTTSEQLVKELIEKRS